MSRTPALVALLLTTLLTACGGDPPARSAATLAFTIVPPEGLALAHETDRTKSYTPGATSVGPTGARVVLTRSTKAFPDKGTLHRDAAEEFIRGNDMFANPSNFQSAPVEVDGLRGYETVCDATDPHGAAIRLYCARLYAADCTFNVLGYWPGGDQEAFMEACRASLRSFTAR